MADNPNPPPSPTRRRSSFVDMFSSRPSNSNAGTATSNSTSNSAVPAMPASPEHPQPTRRVSIAETLGLTTSGTGPTSPYGAFARQRRASVAGSSASGSPEFRNSFTDDSAVIEEDDTLPAGPSPGSSSFGRRLSFGAQALKDVKQGTTVGSPGGGRRPSSALYTLNENHEQVDSGRQSSPQMAKAGEGFNWSDSLRDRSKRTPSFTAGNPFGGGGGPIRARSNSSTQPEPPKVMPKPVEPPTPTRMKKPDHLGERMLRGDFMMD